MNIEQVLLIQGCVRGSLTSEMNFPQIVGRLASAGIERYHADYSRQENTYYLACGASLVVTVPHEPHTTGAEFSTSDVQAAIGQSQREEHTYVDFVRKTMIAGCVGYIVQITGRKVIYMGRKGEMHIEHFPNVTA
jgi:uncharacterized protein YbcV (DUF1398 family)